MGEGSPLEGFEEGGEERRPLYLKVIHYFKGGAISSTEKKMTSWGEEATGRFQKNKYGEGGKPYGIKQRTFFKKKTKCWRTKKEKGIQGGKKPRCREFYTLKRSPSWSSEGGGGLAFEVHKGCLKGRVEITGTPLRTSCEGGRGVKEEGGNLELKHHKIVFLALCGKHILPHLKGKHRKMERRGKRKQVSKGAAGHKGDIL